MDLVWLEDLLSVAEKGHFARAAQARNISQSALTRRIQALERWADAELLDRSSHPIRLTPAGERFSARARDIVGRAAEARAELRERVKSRETTVRIACLHSLALAFVPEVVDRLQAAIGPFQASVVAETRTVNEYLQDLKSAQTDLFICYTNPQVPLGIDLDGFPQLRLADDVIAPFVRRRSGRLDLDEAAGPAIPYLQYGATSYLARVAERIVAGAPFESRLQTVYRATLAESLCSAAAAGMGLTWAPREIARHFQTGGALQEIAGPWRANMTICAFKSAENKRPIVDDIWRALSAQS